MSKMGPAAGCFAALGRRGQNDEVDSARRKLSGGKRPAAARRPLLPRVTVPAVRCGHCGSCAGYRVKKTIDNGDKSVSRYVRCLACRRSYVLTFDPSIPAAGIIERGSA